MQNVGQTPRTGPVPEGGQPEGGKGKPKSGMGNEAVFWNKEISLLEQGDQGADAEQQPQRGPRDLS